MNKNLRQIEGRNPVIEALRHSDNIVKVFIDQGAKGDKVYEITSLCKSKGVPTEIKPRAYLDKMEETGACQGVIAQAKEFSPLSLDQLLEKIKDKDNPLLVLLPETTYEHNLGAVIRTCEVAGTDAVLISNRSKGITSTVTRVSMGATEYLPIIQGNLFDMIKKLKKEDYKIIGAEADKGSLYFEEDLTGALVLIIGGENKGISKPLADRVDAFVNIPMVGKTNSLNLSVSAAIIVFEAVRQRRVNS